MALPRNEADAGRALRLLTAAAFTAVAAQGDQVADALSGLENAANSAVAAYATPGEVLAAYEQGVIEALDVTETRTAALEAAGLDTGGEYADPGDVQAAYEAGVAEALHSQQRRRSAVEAVHAIVAEREAARRGEAA